MFVAVLLSLLQTIALVNGAYTPRSVHARHAAILRARAPAPAPAPLAEPALPVIKKRDSKKCKVRPSTTSSSVAPSSTPVAPVNPASDPNAPSSSTEVTTHHAPTTSSNPPATHTTQKAPPPPPAPTTTKQQPPPSPSPTSSGGGGGNSGGSSGGDDPFGSFFAGTNTGELTFYELGITACGETFTDSDLVAAASELLFDIVPGAGANPNLNPICGKKVKVTYQGNSVTVGIFDRCVACRQTDLDLSPAAFSQLASQSIGRLDDATWEWVS